MPSPHQFATPADYKNYRNVRAAALYFTVIATIVLIAGFALMFIEPNPRADDPPSPVAMRIGGGVCLGLGISGMVGGISILRARRRWHTPIYVIAVIYLFAFPFGTLLGWVILSGLSRYLDDAERLQAARRQPTMNL